jgi:inorganic pyrophosphatase
MADEKGRDQKILAVPDGDPRFREVADLPDLAMHFLAEIRHFFEVYKTLEEKATEIIGWQGAATAEETIRDAQQRRRGRGSKGR